MFVCTVDWDYSFTQNATNAFLWDFLLQRPILQLLFLQMRPEYVRWYQINDRSNDPLGKRKPATASQLAQATVWA